MRQGRKERDEEVTNSTKAWLRLAPTLHLVLTILPKGLHSSTSSSSMHSHGRLRRWSTLEGVWVYRNWCWPEVDMSSRLLQIPTTESRWARGGARFRRQKRLFLFGFLESTEIFRENMKDCAVLSTAYYFLWLSMVFYYFLIQSDYVVEIRSAAAPPFLINRAALSLSHLTPLLI